MILADLIAQIESDRGLWTFAEKTLCAKELTELVDERRQSLRCDGKSRVALELSESPNALSWMLALDGVAGTVFLAPKSLKNSDSYPELKRRFNACITIDDEFSIQKDCAGEEDRANDNAVDTSTRWVLATSGTTGTPKLIEHTTESLTRTCKINTRQGKDYTWGLVYDPFRFAGLQVVLQALASGSRLVLADGQQNIGVQAQLMREHGVNALSATPSFWRKLLMSGEWKGHLIRQITLGGEPADQSLLNALFSAFPTARIAHIYASTEAGVGFSVTDGLAGFPQGFLKSGVGGNQLSIGDSGTLLIKPEKHTPTSYDGRILADNNGYIDTGDLVERRGNRVFFRGRDSGAINVGGNKVIPEEVESVIREVDGVAEVVVKPKNSGVIGQLVTAEVQTHDSVTDKKALKQAIVGHCRQHLEKFKVPAFIRFVAAIEYNPTGKISRK